MNSSKLMVSDEIADQIDESQFVANDEMPTDVSETIILQLESEDALLPGIIEKYAYRVFGVNEEELSLTFMTKIQNITLFHNNMGHFMSAKISLGDEKLAEFDLSELIISKYSVEYDLLKSGCVITVVYK